MTSHQDLTLTVEFYQKVNSLWRLLCWWKD